MSSTNRISTSDHLTQAVFDNVLQPKESGNQSARLKVLYFHPDIQSKIVQRARKQNLIQENTPSDASARKGKVDQSDTSKVDHLGKASKIVEDLIKKHGMAKEKISKLKEQVTRQSEKECFFKPQNISGGDKFVFRGNMIQRNQIWLEQKKRKQIERKQEALVNDLQQCTFSPEISSRKMSQIYLKNKSKIINDHSQHKEQKSSIPMNSPSPIKNKKDISLTQFQSAKKQIKSRLFTIALRN